MSHLKIATLGLPHMKLPKVALPVIRVGDHKKHEHEEYHYDSSHARSHESVSAMADVHERMEKPPHTWEAYHDKPGGLMSIVEMEYRELMECKKEGHREGIKKELTDLAAACICALEKMKDM
ncbi:hypothetical protein OMDBNIEC_00004 [Salmonella phage STP-SP5]|nr:hypothetical protein OMDBNIEC_00004 [Salmonella phage STP-SP5]